MPEKVPRFFIENIPVYGDLILAPMDGITDLPYRSLCRRFGSALSYTSFVSAIEILQGQKRAWRELEFLPEERPVVMQLFDNNVERLLQAAREVSRLHPDIIDINMGCSDRRVSGRGAGAGLLKEPEKISEIIAALSTEFEFPITAKIRLGWDHASLNYLEVAQRIEENGGALIAVHARTRQQAYSGTADWDAIAEIKEAVTIPVIGNGDVLSTRDLDRMLEHTDCDGIMIGRSAIGNPWIFQRRERDEVTVEEVLEVISMHLDAMLNLYGPDLGLILFRKHLKRYLLPMQLHASTLRELLTCNQVDTFLEKMSEVGLPLASIGISPA
jgi:tRNA-dihydrouridine synthase B